jgi:HEAT repeat protein
MCCWSSGDGFGRDGTCCGVCRLEPGSGTTFRTNDQTSSTRLEPRDRFFVFYRIEAKRIERIRMFSEDCAIDAGNRQVYWLTSVTPAESLSFLSNLALSPIDSAASPSPRADLAQGRQDNNRVIKGAIAAIAQHAGNDAVTPLVRLGRDAPDTKVRSEALFWLAQRAGARAMAAITDAINNDPETQVKKQAVFALSQLPPSEGVPKLIELARSHANPVVRKQAMFWLGQSRDPRALTFFEQILKQE